MSSDNNHKIDTFFTQNLHYCFIIFISSNICLVESCTIQNPLLEIFFHCLTIAIVAHVHVSFLPARKIFLFLVWDGLNLSLSCRRNKQKPKKEDREQFGPMGLMRGADREQLHWPK